MDEFRAAGGEVQLDRRLVGVRRVDLPDSAEVWVNDATADPDELRAAAGREVRDETPRGRLPLSHPVLQIVPAKDVTRGRGPGSAADLLRGILHDLPHRRVGLITHKPLVERLPDLLPAADRDRLRMSWFGGALARGANDWYRECDAVVVLGTPRVPPAAVREHLIRLGRWRAAGLTAAEAGWEDDYWSAVTESGGRVTVRTPHYRDHDWHAAYCSLVRSELVQAVGRGRGVLPDGVPVYVVTRENLAPPGADDGRNGYPVAGPGRFAPLTDAQARVLGQLYRAVPGGRQPVVGKVPEMARALGLSQQRVRALLGELRAAGRVQKVGERGGWAAAGNATRP